MLSTKCRRNAPIAAGDVEYFFLLLGKITGAKSVAMFFSYKITPPLPLPPPRILQKAINTFRRITTETTFNIIITTTTASSMCKKIWIYQNTCSSKSSCTSFQTFVLHYCALLCFTYLTLLFFAFHLFHCFAKGWSALPHTGSIWFSMYVFFCRLSTWNVDCLPWFIHVRCPTRCSRPLRTARQQAT